MLNPKTLHPEFFGTPGAIAISLGLPFVINLLYFSCNQNGCPVSWTSLQPYVDQINNSSFFSLNVLYAYLSWILFLVVLEIIVPGEIAQGTLLRDGKTRLQYKFNGTYVIIILSSIISGRFILTNGEMPEFLFVYNHLLEFINVSILVSVAIATYVYIASFLHKNEPILAEGGNTGNPIFDWFIGRELNPRIGNFDIKIFLEMRPGLPLWAILNLIMAHHQYQKFGYVTDSMILVCLFQGYYVVEGTFYEKGLMTMMDITTDGLGFMLIFGDLALVPFTYTIPARFLADHPVHLGTVGVLAVISVFLTGQLVFRLANNQKNAFRRGDASTKHLKYITTASGGKLITSGWWGTARHINYFGDWLIGWSFSLATGFSTPIPYYFVLFFATLLIHRERRDEAKCAEKYKQTWEEYKKLVPSRIIPGIY